MTGQLAGVLAACTNGRPPTRLVSLTAPAGERAVTVRLKLESDNRWGSIKDRTAISLVRSVLDRLERPDSVIIESTSGNLGVALAALAAALGRRFIAVVDPAISAELARRITQCGAEIDAVAVADEQGGYLNARLVRVAELCESVPGAVWVDQYHNPANVRAHYQETAPEIWRQAPDLDSVFVAVSTGGTLAGVGRYFHQRAPHVRVIAVDVPGSRIFGEPTSKRLLTGIGAGRRSTLLRVGDWDDVVVVSDADAIAMCHEIRRATGLCLGGSSGAVLAACLRYLGIDTKLAAPICLCADGGEAYDNTLYDLAWLAGRGVVLDPATAGIVEQIRSH